MKECWLIVGFSWKWRWICGRVVGWSSLLLVAAVVGWFSVFSFL
jgi:hypothetical protein